MILVQLAYLIVFEFVGGGQFDDLLIEEGNIGLILGRMRLFLVGEAIECLVDSVELLSV